MMLVFLSIAAVLTFQVCLIHGRAGLLSMIGLVIQVVMGVTMGCKAQGTGSGTIAGAANVISPSNKSNQMTCNRCLSIDEKTSNPMVCLMIASLLPAILNAISVVLLDFIYCKIAVKLTNWGKFETPIVERVTRLALYF